MQTAEHDTARGRWTQIISSAHTRQQHACILDARRTKGGEDPDALVTEYRRLITADAHHKLNGLPLSAGQIADLAVVVSGGAAGVNAARLDGATRVSLAAHSLTAVRPGSRWGAQDWRATVIATLDGMAVVLAAQGQPVRLTTNEAIPLAVIERAMRTSASGGSASWPGSQLALRVAQMWRLVEYVREPPPPDAKHWSGQLGNAFYRLTAEGLAALDRQRRADGSGPAEVKPQTADVMTRVLQSPRGDLGKLDAATETAVQKCLEAGWLREGPRVYGAGRRVLKLTDSGRDALESWRFRESGKQTRIRPPTRPVSEIEKGQWVRLSNRKQFPGIGHGWVQVADVKHAPTDTRTRLAHNYEVWVTDDTRFEPYLYVGRSLFRTVKFEVKPL